MQLTNLCNIYRNQLLDTIGMQRQIVRAQGVFLEDSAGNQIVDCLAQYGAVPFGHNPEPLTKAVKDYFEQQGPGFVQPFVVEPTQRLSHRLCQLAGDAYKFVVFTCSGTETVEAAIKLARLSSGREKVLSTINSFHGKTYSSLSATGSEKYAQDLIVDKRNYHKVVFNDIDALETALATGEYAAFIVEPIQGEGGMIEATAEYLKTAEALCKHHGTLFLLDEIQTGIGRTGYFLAAHKYDVKPDMVLLSKALGGGIYPIGAVIVKKGAYNKDFDKKHSSTFANGGLGAQVANAVLDQFEQQQDLLEAIRNKETYIRARLGHLEKTFPDVFSFTGAGLMYALRFKDDHSFNNYIISFCQNRDVLSYIITGYLLNEKKFLCMPFLGDAYGAIRFEPSLTVSQDIIVNYINAIEEICLIIKNRRYDVLMGYLIGRTLETADLASLIQHPVDKDEVLGDFAYSEEKTAPRFAFLMHATSSVDVARGLPLAIRQKFNRQEQHALADWVMRFGAIDPTPERTVQVTMRSKTGKLVEGLLIFSPMRPEEMMKLTADEKKQLINDYLDVAEREQVDVVGLGAFTSVISRAGADISPRNFHLTTGNSFTALSTAEAVKQAMGPEISHKNLMVIGARGSVGRLAFMELCRYFKNVYLIGSGRSGTRPLFDTIAAALVELIDAGVEAKPDSALARAIAMLHLMDMDYARVIAELRTRGAGFLQEVINNGLLQGVSFPFDVSCEISDFVDYTDCVVTVTSEGKPFIKANIFKRGTKVFDTARPFDVIDDETESATGVTVYEGGLVDQPQETAFGDCNMIGSRPGINLACLSETIALAMEGVNHNYSVGPNIPFLEAKAVFNFSTKHGFTHYLGTAEQSLLDDVVLVNYQ
ncbi:aminotransferase class III-fold pyridoxal phosphate-dependent enzyme [Cellvibrio japonicus]|uniref:Aminotransferase n=1 Tax=Cellvibrio japonicus (strain Ueda107) TaxID=498211 RepID=B3PI07_CELJU|nr:aminotransferase class III-fold pyridoxal phosphate-dependent enzyme [Cellvibrio japonicus]ACE85240.1 aminotransferase [Cellvibrio japonicus Ueda107]